MAKKYLSLERLADYDKLIKAEIKSDDASILSSAKSYVDTKVSGITNGDIIIKEAEHSASADSATNADHSVLSDSATKATQDASGNVITSTYETKTDASAKLTEAKTYTDSSVDELAANVAYIDNEDNEDVVDNNPTANIIVDSALSTTSTNPVQNKVITNKINTISNEIKVERERINQLTSLGEGSTTGDAELVDARTDYTGKTWNNVGEHIRSVSTQLSRENAELKGDIDNQEAKFVMNLNDLNNLTENANIAYGTATCTSDWKKADILKFDLKSGTGYKVFVTLEDAPTGSTYVYLDRGTGTTDAVQMNGKTEHIYSLVPSVDSHAVLQIASESYTGKVSAYVNVNNQKNIFDKTNDRFEKNEFEINDTVMDLCFYEDSNVSVKILKNQSETKVDASVSGKVKLPSCESYFIEFENALFSSDVSGNIEIKIAEFDSGDKVISKTMAKLTEHKILVKKAPTAVNTEIIISYSNTPNFFILTFDKIRLYINAKKSIREDVKIDLNDTSNVKYLKSIIPKYWVENETDYTMYLEDKIKSANSIISDAKFTFLTDPHWLGNAKNSNNIFGYVTKKLGIMNCFNGGDVLMNMTDTPLAKQAKFSMNSYMSDLNDIIPKNLHYIMGNHDTNQTNAPSGATSSDYDNARLAYKDIYEACIEPWENGKHFSDRLEWTSWAIGTPQYYWNRMHYYVDDQKARIRYIVLNSGAYGEIASLVGSNGEEFYWQLNWLYQTLMSTEEGWTCIVFAHQFLSDKETDTENHYYDMWSYSKPIAKMLISARNKTVYRPDFTHIQVQESYDFTNIKSIDVACMICGHSHVDESIIYDASTDIAEIGNAVTSNSQMLLVATTCDAYTNTVHPQYEMVKGTTTEQAFDIFSVDKTNKKIYTTRIGVGKDREFKYATN